MFSLAKSLPKHTSPLPRTQNARPNEGITEQLGTALIFIYSFWFLTRLAAWPICHLDPRYDWLETCRGRAGTELLPGPKAHLLQLWVIYCWPGISVVFVSKRWNVRWLSDPTCWASHPCLSAVKRVLQANTLSKMCCSFGPCFTIFMWVFVVVLTFWCLIDISVDGGKTRCGFVLEFLTYQCNIFLSARDRLWLYNWCVMTSTL